MIKNIPPIQFTAERNLFCSDLIFYVVEEIADSVHVLQVGDTSVHSQEDLGDGNNYYY